MSTVDTKRLSQYIRAAKRWHNAGIVACGAAWVVIFACIGFTGGHTLVEHPLPVTLLLLLSIASAYTLVARAGASALALGAELLVAAEHAQATRIITQGGRGLAAVDSVR